MGGIGLWGEEFSIPPTQEVVKSIKAKTSSQLQQLKNKTDEQKIRSKIVDIHEKIRLIRENVYKKLGIYANNTVVIYNKEEFVNYIDNAIKNGAIAIDTETNNSLDPTTCKIMGLCIYTDGEKQAYIPVNHVDPDTKEKLSNQLTDEDIKEQLLRLDGTKIIMHNAPFDYQVIGYTCGVWLHVDWDTMVASKILNENEEAKLKVQYTTKIDPSIEKYDITSFFGNIEYSLVPPDVFSLYAATDAFMTYKLYLYQKEIFELPENNKLYKLFIDVEMPIDTIASNMERVGVCIDTDYANRLKESYNRRIAEVDKKIEKEVEKMSDAILEWRLTPEANFKPKKKKATKDGNEYDKSKNEQLPDPINVSSNTQLAIIMYDVLKLPVINKDKPRGTDNEILEELVKKNNFVLGDLILEKRGLYKLLSTYIDAIPNQISPRDGRLHAHFNSVGTNCIVGETLIPTPSGYRKIKDIVDEFTDIWEEVQPASTELFNMYGDIEQCDGVVKYHDRNVLDVLLEGGLRICGVPNHRAICLTSNNNKNVSFDKDVEFRRLDELHIGDFVVVPMRELGVCTQTEYVTTNWTRHDLITHKNKENNIPSVYDENVAELLGMYHADGTLKDSNGSCHIGIHNCDQFVRNRVKELSKIVFGVDVTEYISKNKENEVSTYININHINEIREELPRGAKNKKIPNWVFCSPCSVINAYIRGMTLDSNLYVRNNSACFQLHVMDKEDADFLHQYLFNYGIESSIMKQTLRDGNYFYRIKMRNRATHLFAKLIGFISKKQVELLDVVYGIGGKSKYPIFDGYTIRKVVGIENKVADVYDVCMPKTHSFIGGGVINHNTGRFSSSSPNLQNIPSNEKTIRMMFRASDGYEIVGGDFSLRKAG